MKLHLLEKVIDQFLSSRLRADAIEWYFPHALVNEFHTHWSAPLPANLKDVYEHCLQSEYSQRWWKRDQYRPKEIMLQLIEAEVDLAVVAWKDLSNESATLEGRLDRFDYYCNELLQIHRHKHIRSVESYHHQDASIISLYLAGMYPEKYVLYPGLEVFQSFCRAIGSPEIPVVQDLVRYMKIATIVFTFMKKNDKYQLLIQQREPSMHKVAIVPFLVSYEVIEAEGQRYKAAGV
jgi:hypothetical protein